MCLTSASSPLPSHRTPALTSRGFGADDFDRVAELIVEVLTATSARSTASGGASSGGASSGVSEAVLSKAVVSKAVVSKAVVSKAKYDLPAGVAEKVRAGAAELLDAHPLYPGLDLS